MLIGVTCKFHDSKREHYSWHLPITIIGLISILSSGLISCTGTVGGEGLVLAWVRQFGSDPGSGPLYPSSSFFRNRPAAQEDLVAPPAIDNKGNIYVVGSTYGILPGESGFGLLDSFIRKYDPSGQELWTHQFGTSRIDSSSGVATDETGVYMVGGTQGVFPGQNVTDNSNTFLRKYDANGNELWTRQFFAANPGGSRGASIATSESGIYVTNGASVIKFDSSGNELWRRSFVANSRGGVYADSSGVYIAGYTSRDIPGQEGFGGKDAFVRKYDHNGAELWTHQFGTSDDEYGEAITGSSSGIYVTGSTWGTFPGQKSSGGENIFVRKYDGDGNEIWTRQFNASWGYPYGRSGACADANGFYLVGIAHDLSFPGESKFGSADSFVRKYDSKGNVLWTRLLGTPAADYALGVSVDSRNIYVVGVTEGAFSGLINSGGQDVFIIKFEASK